MIRVTLAAAVFVFVGNYASAQTPLADPSQVVTFATPDVVDEPASLPTPQTLLAIPEPLASPPFLDFDEPPASRLWLIPALELGWSKAQHTPAAVYAGTVRPNGSIARGPQIYGNQELGQPFRTGFSLAGGYWFNDAQTHGIDASFYYLSTGTTDFTLFADGNHPLLQPVLDPATGRLKTFTLAGPKVGDGAYQTFSETRYETADVNYRQMLLAGDGFRLDALLGYRYAHLGEGLHLYDKRIDSAGSLIRTKDHISDTNQYHAGQIGLAGEYRVDRWYIGVTGKVAFGEVFTSTNQEGAFRVNGVVDPYGFYTRPAVSGSRSHSDFAVMPSTSVVLGRQVCRFARVFVGYSFQYLSRVTRPDNVFDPLPEYKGPGLSMSRDASRSDFWVQSMTLGMELRY